MRRPRVLLKLWLRRVIKQEGKPESIAAGVAIGTFISMTPMVGVQMIISVAIATVARANKIAAAAMAWITNPLTIPPIYYFNYRVGALVLGGETTAEVRAKFDILGQAAADFQWVDFRESVGVVFRAIAGLGGEILWPLILGCLVVGTILGLASYPLTLRAVLAFRERRARRSAKKLAPVTGGAVGLGDEGELADSSISLGMVDGEDSAGPAEAGEDAPAEDPP